MNGRSLRRILASAVAMTLAGGIGVSAKAETTLEMAYMPIVPCSQLFVMEGMGWAKEAGINLKLTRFSNGPAIVAIPKRCTISASRSGACEASSGRIGRGSDVRHPAASAGDWALSARTRTRAATPRSRSSGSSPAATACAAANAAD